MLIDLFYFLEDILLIGNVGHEIIIPEDNSSIELLGDHGYDHRDKSMHPIFYGFGPAFRRNIEAASFHSVDLYPLMSYILHLDERITNGTLDNVKHILRDFSTENSFDEIYLLISNIIMKIISWDLTSKYNSEKFV